MVYLTCSVKYNFSKVKIMLTKPEFFSSNFQLEGTSVYQLCHLNEIACDWVEKAIHGLESLTPFCVKGFLDPERMLCTVSYWNCHIVCEDYERYPLVRKNVKYEICHMSMLQFCQDLYEDISMNINEWAAISFYKVKDIDALEGKEILMHKLDQLKKVISEREDYFDASHYFC